jgi:hypothetical protein
MTVTYRSVKGAPLSIAEADANAAQFDLKTKDGWADIVSEFYIRDSPSCPGTSPFIGGIYLLEFNPTDTLEAFANFHVPHAYKPNTRIYPHVHFGTTSNETGVVRWVVEWSFARRHDSTGQTTFPATQNIVIEFTVPANSAHKHFVAEAAEGFGIPGTHIEVDGMILCRIYREAAHANDTFPDSVWAITADMHIEVDRHATPNRGPDFYA